MTLAEPKTILILGGGVGGLVAASRLRKKLAPEHRVVLIEREAQFTFQPSFLWLMIGWRMREQIRRPLAALERKGIELVRGNIEHIDPESRTVRVGEHTYVGDYLVVALGADLAPAAIPGLAEAGHNFYSLNGAEALREARLQMREGRLVVLVAGVPFKCPAAPYEAAMLLEHDCRKRNTRSAVTIELYTPEPGPMAVTGPENSRQVRQMVEAKGIGFYPDHAVTEIDTAAQQIKFANGAAVPYDLLAYVPPHRVPEVVSKAGLVGESGWVSVARETMQTRFPGVYAIGDVTGIPLSMGKPLPKAGVFAHGEAEVVAKNLARVITGKGNAASFNGQGECFLETGDGKAGYGSGNFFAEPVPRVRLRRPGRILHFGKVAFEKYWLFRWF
jgi:sulfide:quinone oxidoreductase